MCSGAARGAGRPRQPLPKASTLPAHGLSGSVDHTRCTARDSQDRSRIHTSSVLRKPNHAERGDRTFDVWEVAISRRNRHRPGRFRFLVPQSLRPFEAKCRSKNKLCNYTKTPYRIAPVARLNWRSSPKSRGLATRIIRGGYHESDHSRNRRRSLYRMGGTKSRPAGGSSRIHLSSLWGSRRQGCSAASLGISLHGRVRPGSRRRSGSLSDLQAIGAADAHRVGSRSGRATPVPCRFRG